MKIPFVNLKKQSIIENKIILKSVKSVLKSSNFILGKENTTLENLIKKYNKVKYCALVSSGTDALILALHVLGVKKGDEVITTSNVFIASVASIVHLGAKPVFVDVQADQNMDPNKIESKITKKTKCIMPIHLTGRVCDMSPILKIAKKYKLKIVEDAAQSFGSKYKGKMAGTFGDIGCVSLHPLKNFNAIGDGGLILTNNKKYYSKISNLRNHGLIDRNHVNEFGYVARLDTIKAAILIQRLKNLNKNIKTRRRNAKLYQNLIHSSSVFIPPETKNEFNTYHTFVIQAKNRDKLKKYLEIKGISTSIHYPIPIHLQKAFKKNYKIKPYLPITTKQTREILSLPINQFLKMNEIKFISNCINNFYRS